MRASTLGLAVAAVIVAASVAAVPVVDAAAGPPRGDHPKFSARARRLAAESSGRDRAERDENASVGLAPSGPGSLLRDQSRAPLFTVRVSDTGHATLEGLRSQGARIVHVDEASRRVTVAAPARRLSRLSEVAGVEHIAEVLAPETSRLPVAAPPATLGAPSCGPPWSEGDAQLQAATARDAFGVAGAGVTVGVMSDSFDQQASAVTHAPGDVASGNLPGPGNPCGHTTPVDVIDDSGSGLDEGRAMAQIVHDLAPAAGLAFATATGGLYQMAARVGSLVAAGADVIVDDVTYFVEPFFQEGPVGTAVTSAEGAGVAYFSSAGNTNLVDAGQPWNGYEAPAFRATACPAGVPGYQEACHDFNGGATVDPTYGLTLGAGQAVRAVLQWAEPWYGVATDLDAYLLEGSVVRAQSEDPNPAGTEVPFEFLYYENNTGTTKTLNLAVGRPEGSGAPRLKTVFYAGATAVSSVEHRAPVAPDGVTGTIFGHNGAADAVTVAATRYDDGSTPETFSARGPVTYYFGAVNGALPAAPLPVPLALAKPDLTATDGGQNTFFLPPGPPYRFYGTSAAAPHAAAVAALLRQRAPAATPDGLAAILAATATPMAAGPTAIGAGLVNALDALGSVGSPPDGFNGVIDPARGVGDETSYAFLQALARLYNASDGCAPDPANWSSCLP